MCKRTEVNLLFIRSPGGIHGWFHFQFTAIVAGDEEKDMERQEDEEKILRESVFIVVRGSFAKNSPINVPNCCFCGSF